MAPETQPAPPLKRALALLGVHWQVLSSALLLGAGVWGLAETYPDYCGQTELTYAPTELRDDLEAAAQVAGFSPGLLAAQLETESAWNAQAQSSAGALGLAQFTLDTWDIWSKGNILSPEDSIAAQGRYLAYLSERLAPLVDDQRPLLDLVLAGYNAGPGAVEIHEGVPPYFETQNYVARIKELAGDKYSLTCHPSQDFRQAVLVR